MKKLFALLLSLVMIMALAAPAMAAGGTGGSGNFDDNNGKITITNAVEGQTYAIYRIFDLKSFSYEGSDKEGGHYAYVVNSDWKTFLEQATIKDVYVKFDAATGGSVSWVASADAQAFAKLALEYAKDAYHTISSVESKVAGATGTVEFTSLPLGYYLIDSSLGALCTLDTTDNEVTVLDKNSKPTIKLTVGTGDTSTTSADIGAEVSNKITVNVGSEVVSGLGTGVDADYVVEVTLPTGLDYDATAGAVTITGWTENTDYTVTAPGGGSQKLTITLKADKLKTIAQNTDIVITYGTKLNSSATVGGDGNESTATLSYNGYTTPAAATAATTVYTYGFIVLKVDGGSTEAVKPALGGAKFRLYKDVGGTKNYATFDTSGNFTGWTTTEGDATIRTSDTADGDHKGKIDINGLAAGDYFLEETEAPEGFNLLEDAVKVTIGEDGTVGLDTVTPPTGASAADGTVTVENNSGSRLPSTGGIGTTIFYVVGGILVLVAVVLLVTRRKMNKYEEQE